MKKEDKILKMTEEELSLVKDLFIDVSKEIEPLTTELSAMILSKASAVSQEHGSYIASSFTAEFTDFLLRYFAHLLLGEHDVEGLIDALYNAQQYRMKKNFEGDN